MTPIETCRCPSCGVLNAIGERTYLRCLGPLALTRPTADIEPVTGETCSLYRAKTTGALLLLASSALEYSATGIAFVTVWSNVESIMRRQNDDYLWLSHTPQNTRLALTSSSVWFSDITRAIPLRQFGYPTNYQLRLDLGRYAPALRRYLPKAATIRD